VSLPAEGYALRSRLLFPAHDDPADGPGPRYAYNLMRPDTVAWDAIVLVVDEAGETAALHARDGLLAGLAALARRTLLVVVPDAASAPARGPGGAVGRGAGRWSA
jgi:hypothetical protein